MLCAAPGTVFCDTCAKHRERAHAPVAIFTTDIGRLNSDRNNERAEPKAEFCHGAGPAGTAYDLLEQVPYPLTIRLGEGKFNRMYYREAA